MNNKKNLFLIALVVVTNLLFSCTSSQTFSSPNSTEPENTTVNTPSPNPTETEIEQVGAWCNDVDYVLYCYTCANLGPDADPKTVYGCHMLNNEDQCQRCGI